MKIQGTRQRYHGEHVKRKETTRDERLRVVILREDAGMKWKEIEERTGIDYRTCEAIYRRTKLLGTPSNRKRKGRTPLFSDIEKERLRAFVTRDRNTRRMSWLEIKNEMGYVCSPRLVQETMASMGYHKRRARRKWGIRPYNKVKRVQWCQEREHWTEEDWLRVVWTDESTYSTKGFAFRPMVIRTADEEFHPDCIDEEWESGRKSVMVWGAFCGELKSELFFVPSGAKLDSGKYTQHILDPLLIPFWHQACEFYGWTVVLEDGAPGHKGISTECRRLNEMESLPWVAQSPDLNLIEILWADLEVELGLRYDRIDDMELLQEELHREWGNITKERLLGLIKTMPDRLRAVIAAGGEPTPY